MNVAAAGSPRDDLVGKNAALALVMLPLVAAVGTALAAITGGWLYLPVAVGLAVGALGAAFAVGNVVSVRAPFSMPQSRTNVWATSGAGRAWYAAFVQFMALIPLGVLVFPIFVGTIAGLALGPTVLIPVGLGSVVYGVAIWRVGVLVADEWLRGREPELLAALMPERD